MALTRILITPQINKRLHESRQIIIQSRVFFSFKMKEVIHRNAALVRIVLFTLKISSSNKSISLHDEEKIRKDTKTVKTSYLHLLI